MFRDVIRKTCEIVTLQCFIISATVIIFVRHVEHTDMESKGHFLFSWRDSPLVGLGPLLIHEDFCGF